MRILAFGDFTIRVFVGILVRFVDTLAVQVGYLCLDMPLGYDVGYRLISRSMWFSFIVQIPSNLLHCVFVRILNHQ